MKITGLASLALVLCLISPARASSMPPDKAMQERLAQAPPSYMGANAFMGTVLVAQGDSILLDQGYGYANLEWNIPNAPDVKFRLASITKQFTAAVVLLLDQDGKLKLGDHVTSYLPDAPPRWKDVTIAELLGHTSGVANFNEGPDYDVWSMSKHTPQEELRLIERAPLDFAPGSRYRYSNSNFEILGAIVEKVTGQEFGQVLHDRVLAPLGMTGSGMDTDQLLLHHRAQGYLNVNGELQQDRYPSMSIPWAAGAMYSTTHDLLRWERGLFGGRLLSLQSVTAMTTPGKGGYGLGVGASTRDGVLVVSHQGQIEGFNGYLAYIPQKKITVVVLGNVNGRAPGALGGQLVDIALGRSAVLPTARRSQPIAASALPRYAGTYTSPAGAPINITLVGDHLNFQDRESEPPTAMFYEGRQDGKDRFFDPVDFVETVFPQPDCRTQCKIMVHAFHDDVTATKL